MKKLKTKYKVIIFSVFVLLTLGIILFVCLWNGVIQLNNPSKSEYPVRGVDVSRYQGEIDWAVLSEQDGISFAFIKATEGSSFTDPCFEYNYTEALQTKLRVGVYHFFSFDSAGKTQAEHFIKTVPKNDNMLPPVIDLEFYGDKESNPPSREAVQRNLDEMLNTLEEHYSVKPIIYVTEDSYSAYIEGAYEEYDIWYRNVLTSKGPPDGRQWTFWQYTNRKKLEGYSGAEKYIDMNVFRGTKEEFETYGFPECFG